MGTATERLTAFPAANEPRANNLQQTGRVTPGPRAIMAPQNMAAAAAFATPEPRRDLAKMISRQKEHIQPATDHVLGGDWAITPLLTSGDDIGLEMADIAIQAGYSTIGESGSTPTAYYCLSGEAIYRNLETQTTHYFRTGSMWTIPARTRFRFTSLFATRLIAVASARSEAANGADDAPYFPLMGK